MQANYAMTSLQKELEKQLISVIKPGSRVWFIDYPVYENIGDILITKGSEVFFQKYGIQVVGRSSLLNYRFSPLPPDCTLVCQGGGNFGDLYERHQLLREQAIQRFPDRRIVVLPQTIYFTNADRLKASARIFKKHPKVYLFARDCRSLELAGHFTDNALLCPDMAHELWPVTGGGKALEYSTLYLLRSDCETGSGQPGIPSEPIKDWKTLLSKTDKYAMRILQKLHELDKKAVNSCKLYNCWRWYTNRLAAKAVKEFSRYGTIVTSRLHGHILACLMNKQNYLLDNSYGKNHFYYKTWTKKVPCANWGWNTSQ